jgi:enoyl-CoA hydratase/carnithine racemase
MADGVQEFETILYRLEDGIAFLTLNRPEALNALSRQMTSEIIAACQLIHDDPSVRVVILSGAGERAFCAGMDLKERAAGSSVSPIDHRALRVRPAPTAHHKAIAAVDRPTIAAIHGWAVGGGLEVALACDIRVASEDAKLGLTEVHRGIIPGAGGTQRLARVVGKGHALKMTLTGEPIDAQEAYRIGLVSEVVPRAQLMDAALAMAQKIGRGAPIATRFAKEAINKGIELPLDEGLRLEVDLSTLISQTEDAKEGPRAFAEKRPAVWQGR